MNIVMKLVIHIFNNIFPLQHLKLYSGNLINVNPSFLISGWD